IPPHGSGWMVQIQPTRSGLRGPVYILFPRKREEEGGKNNNVEAAVALVESGPEISTHFRDCAKNPGYHPRRQWLVDGSGPAYSAIPPHLHVIILFSRREEKTGKNNNVRGRPSLA